MTKNIPVFDIGDTLSPSNNHINQYIKNQIKNNQIPEFDVNKYNIYRTKDIKKWLKENKIQADPEKIREKHIEEKNRHFQESEVLNILKKVNKQFGPIGFISDNSIEAKEYYNNLFDRHNLKYKGFVVSEEVGVKKPDRKIFDAFLEKRQEPASRFTYFGNYVDRDKGATKTGMNFVWVKQFHTFNSGPYTPSIQKLTFKNITKQL